MRQALKAREDVANAYSPMLMAADVGARRYVLLFVACTELVLIMCLHQPGWVEQFWHTRPVLLCIV